MRIVDKRMETKIYEFVGRQINTNPNYLKEQYDIFECKQLTKLNETGGVATYEYNNEIINLVAEIKKLAFNPRQKKANFSFNVNEKEATSIKLAKKVIINIEYYSKNKYPNDFAEYQTSTLEYNKTTNEVYKIVITIHMSRNAPNFNSNLYYDLLTHEFNHATDDVYRKIHNATSLYVSNFTDKSKVDYIKLKKELHKNKQETFLIAYFIYRLFVDTEFNAIISETYSQLNSISSKKKENFYLDFKQTENYKDYHFFKETLKYDFSKTHDWMQIAIQFFNKKFSSLQFFREWFIKTAHKRIEELYKRICKAASLYYFDIDVNNTDKDEIKRMFNFHQKINSRKKSDKYNTTKERNL